MKTIILFRSSAVLSLTLVVTGCAGVGNVVSTTRPAQARVIQPAPYVPELKAPVVARPHTYQATVKRPTAVVKPRPRVRSQYNKPVVNRYPGTAPKVMTPKIAPPPQVVVPKPAPALTQRPEDEGVDVDPYANIPDGEEVSQSTSPVVEALLVRAYADTKLGRLDAAMGKLERGLRIEPQNPKLWYQLAEVNYKAGNYQQAITMAKKAIDLSSRDEEMMGKNWEFISKVARKSGNNGALAEAEAYNRR